MVLRGFGAANDMVDYTEHSDEIPLLATQAYAAGARGSISKRVHPGPEVLGDGEVASKDMRAYWAARPDSRKKNFCRRNLFKNAVDFDGDGSRGDIWNSVRRARLSAAATNWSNRAGRKGVRWAMKCVHRQVDCHAGVPEVTNRSANVLRAA